MAAGICSQKNVKKVRPRADLGLLLLNISMQAIVGLAIRVGRQLELAAAGWNPP